MADEDKPKRIVLRRNLRPPTNRTYTSPSSAANAKPGDRIRERLAQIGVDPDTLHEHEPPEVYNTPMFFDELDYGADFRLGPDADDGPVYRKVSALLWSVVEQDIPTHSYPATNRRVYVTERYARLANNARIAGTALNGQLRAFRENDFRVQFWLLNDGELFRLRQEGNVCRKQGDNGLNYLVRTRISPHVSWEARMIADRRQLVHVDQHTREQIELEGREDNKLWRLV